VPAVKNGEMQPSLENDIGWRRNHGYIRQLGESEENERNSY